MSSVSSSHRRSFRAFALVALLAAVPTACLNLEGLPAESTSSSSGAGGTGGVELTTSTSGAMVTATSGASASSGGPIGCTPGTISPCYSGPAGTQGKGICKGGTYQCQPDGMSFDTCKGEVLPAALENCAAAADEDCNGATPACTGMTLGGDGITDIPSDDDVIFAVAADKAGNLVLGGVRASTPNGALGYAVYSGDGYVAKLSPTGQELWSKAVTTGAGGFSVVRGVATDATGNVLIVGEYKGAMAGNGFTLAAADVVDVFLMKLDATTGAPLWQKRFTGPNGQYANAIALDTSGNIFLTGATFGSIDLGGGGKVGMGGSDLFVAKLDSSGKHLWSNAFGDANAQVGYGAAVTHEGNVVVAGLLTGTMDLGSGKSLTVTGGEDAFVAKFKGDTGVALWAHNYGDNSNQQANGVAVGSDGSVVITGSMIGKANFGGGDLDAKKTNSDVFVVKLNANGSHQWSHNYGSDMENQVGLGVAIDPAQNVVVTGYLKGTLAFGSTLTLTEAASSPPQSTDAFVAKLAADGSALWARSFGDTTDQAAWAVATDASANVLVGGSFQGTMNLPPSITSTGSYDAFWLKLAP